MLRLPRNLRMEVHKVLCLPRILRMEVHKVLCLPRNLHTLRGSASAAPATKSANEPHVQKSRFTAPVTKSELLDDHRQPFEANPLRSLAPVTISRL